MGPHGYRAREAQGNFRKQVLITNPEKNSINGQPAERRYGLGMEGGGMMSNCTHLARSVSHKVQKEKGEFGEQRKMKFQTLN